MNLVVSNQVELRESSARATIKLNEFKMMNWKSALNKDWIRIGSNNNNNKYSTKKEWLQVDLSKACKS